MHTMLPTPEQAMHSATWAVNVHAVFILLLLNDLLLPVRIILMSSDPEWSWTDIQGHTHCTVNFCFLDS